MLRGDARNSSVYDDELFDLIIIHRPYLNIVQYSKDKIKEDLSSISSLPKFCDEIEKVASELFRVIKPNRYCALLIGDTRKGQHYVPISYYVLEKFLNAGFALKEEIIKAQHNCTYSKRWEMRLKQFKFYLHKCMNIYLYLENQKKTRTFQESGIV